VKALILLVIPFEKIEAQYIYINQSFPTTSLRMTVDTLPSEFEV
jgi:hypothetical protein